MYAFGMKVYPVKFIMTIKMFAKTSNYTRFEALLLH